MSQVQKNTLVKEIARDVAKLLLPRMKKIIIEATNDLKKDLLIEILREESYNKNINEAKNAIASKYQNPDTAVENNNSQTLSERARNLGFDLQDPSMAMIYDVEDPEIEVQKAEDLKIESAGSIKVSDATDETPPENIDYSSFLNKMDEYANK